MSASFGPISENDLNEIIKNVDPSLSDSSWAVDGTGKEKSISSEGLRLTFYCGAKTFFVQGKSSKVECLARKLDSLGVQRKSRKRGITDFTNVDPTTELEVPCWKVSMKKEICEIIDNATIKDTFVKEKLLSHIESSNWTPPKELEVVNDLM